MENNDNNINKEANCKASFRVFDCIDDCIIVLNQNSEIAFVNSFGISFFKLQDKNFIGKKCTELNHVSKSLAELDALIKKNTKSSKKTTTHFVKEKKKWLSIRIQSDCIEPETESYFICQVKDVSEENSEKKKSEFSIEHKNEFISEIDLNLNILHNFQTLNQMFSEMLTLNNFSELYQFVTRQLHGFYPQNIVLYISINEEIGETRLEAISGIENKIFKKVLEVTGNNPIGKTFKLLQQYNNFFRSGKLVHFEGGLSEFSSSEFPVWMSKMIEKLIGLKQIHTIGINKDESLIAAIHFFSFGTDTNFDADFIELFVKKAGIIIQNKLAEYELIDNQKKLKELNDLKDKLFSIIGHDLKNPIHIINGFSELIANNIESCQKEKIIKYNSQILESSHQVNALLDNLLKWSMTMSQNTQMQQREVSPYAMADTCINTLTGNIKNKELLIENTIPAVLKAFADENMISTVIRNLLSNAIKFSKEKGAITIGAYTERQRVIVYVKDSGKGIEEERMHKLFSVTKNKSTEGTAGEKGAGLGLLISKDFVELNKGKIWVESEVGKGSTFYFSLPKSNNLTH